MKLTLQIIFLLVLVLASGVKLCSFKFDTQTINLLNHVAEQTGLSKTALLASALADYASKHNLTLPK